MSIWINIFIEIRILKSYLIWRNIMVVSMIKNWCSYNNGYQYPPLGFVAFVLLYSPIAIEFISGRFVVMFTWIVVIGLINTIWGVPTTPVEVVFSAKLQLKFLITKTPFNSLPNFVIYPINIPFFTTSMLGTTTISTPVVVTHASTD